jgi:NAD(P)-dependent dehydrogenase (short-subunit alcohol dehydrogenase family)
MPTSRTSLAAFSLEGRRAVVTGASRGIGAAIAVGLAGAGADLAVCSRSPSELEGTARSIRAMGRRCLDLGCDVSDGDDVDAFAARVLDDLGPVDILVNNAGGPLFQAPILDVEAAGWERVFALNVHSVLRLSQLFGREMLERRRGSIINVASIPPTRAWPAIAAYSAAKAAVLNLTQSLAASFAPQNVRVNAICPGWVRTSLNATYLRRSEAAGHAVDAVPLGRWAETHGAGGDRDLARRRRVVVRHGCRHRRRWWPVVRPVTQLVHHDGGVDHGRRGSEGGHRREPMTDGLPRHGSASSGPSHARHHGTCP